MARVVEAITLVAMRDWFFTAQSCNRYPASDHHINPKQLNEDFTRILERLGLPVRRDDFLAVPSLRRFFRASAVNSHVPERVVNICSLTAIAGH